MSQKQIKAKNLRYKKPLAKVNFEQIENDLYEIGEACDEVRYFIEMDDETLLNALNGDEEEEYEFRMMFADLSAECERMQDDLEYKDELRDYFDLIFVVCEDRDMMGYDEDEGDYFGLDAYESEWAEDEGRKKLMRLTKAELLDLARDAFRLYRNYAGLMYRYDCLKASLDILREQNTGYLQLVKQIEETYDRAEQETEGFKYEWRSKAVKELDRLIESMPQEAWL